MRQDIGIRNGTQLKLFLDAGQLVLLELDDAFGRVDLRPQRRLGDRCCDHVRRERKNGRFQLEPLVFCRGHVGFDLPARAAEEIETVGDRNRGVAEIVDIARRLSGRSIAAPRLRIAQADLGIERGTGGYGRFPCGKKRILRGLDTGMVADRLLNKSVQLGGSEHLPPLATDVAAKREFLGSATTDAIGCGGRSDFSSNRIASTGCHIGRRKVGPHIATGKQDRRG